MSAPHADEPLLDARVRIDNLPPEGRELEVEATPSQRLAIAELIKISSLERLHAQLTVTKLRGGLRVLGTLEATTIQPCVVTFVPVRQEIADPFDRIFLPATEQPKTAGAHPEVFVDLETDDLPDYFDGAEVDLSDALVEIVALALDPYPRAEGAGIEALGVTVNAPVESPFARLKTLLDPDDPV